MNYLSHSFFRTDHDVVNLGNFIGDTIRNNELDDVNMELVSGVYFHRYLDSWTDQQEDFKISAKRVRRTHGKFAKVVVDVLYDYLLHKYWDRFCELSVDEHVEYCIDSFHELKDYLPSRVLEVTNRMIKNDIFRSATSIYGLERTFNFLDHRTSSATNFGSAVPIFLEHEEDFSKEFLSFFPEMIQMSVDWCKKERAFYSLVYPNF